MNTSSVRRNATRRHPTGMCSINYITVLEDLRNEFLYESVPDVLALRDATYKDSHENRSKVENLIHHL